MVRGQIIIQRFSFCTDIQFWNKNKSMEGLSAKTVVVSFICQLIIFLYLLDNDTSWMILLSSGVGLVIEFWKIGKAMHIEVLFVIFQLCSRECLLNFYIASNIVPKTIIAITEIAGFSPFTIMYSIPVSCVQNSLLRPFIFTDFVTMYGEYFLGPSFSNYCLIVSLSEADVPFQLCLLPKIQYSLIIFI